MESVTAPKPVGTAGTGVIAVTRVLGRFQALAALLGIIVAAIIMSPRTPQGSNIFLQAGNLTDIVQQVSVIGIVAVAMTFVILTAGIDLSVGSSLALSTSVIALVLTKWFPSASNGPHILLAITATLILGGLVGAVNGVVVAGTSIQPFIVTLAAMIGVRGLAKRLTANANIDIGFGSDVAAVFADLVSRKAVIIGSLLLTTAVFWAVLDRTVFGRYVRAIGDNEQAALHGPARGARQDLGVYAFGTHVGACRSDLRGGEPPGESQCRGCLRAGRDRRGGDRRDSLMGGKGSVAGTLVGTLILGILTNILRLNNVDSNVEMMVKAGIILLAVAVMTGRKSE